MDESGWEHSSDRNDDRHSRRRDDDHGHIRRALGSGRRLRVCVDRAESSLVEKKCENRCTIVGTSGGSLGVKGVFLGLREYLEGLREWEIDVQSLELKWGREGGSLGFLDKFFLRLVVGVAKKSKRWGVSIFVFSCLFVGVIKYLLGCHGCCCFGSCWC